MHETKKKNKHTGVVENTVDTLGALGLNLGTKAVDIVLVGDIDLDGSDARRLLGLVSFDGLLGQTGRVDGVSATLVQLLDDL